jgi:tRNA (guanine-N7-)-methyltransferase
LRLEVDAGPDLRNDPGMLTVADIVVEPPAIDAVFDPRPLFPDGRPIELEIGCGKGGFLLRRARESADRGFVGLEWANKYFQFAADRMARWNLSNVRIMRTDARHLFVHHMAKDCLNALHVYHPDPWPKKRHHKRRLFTAEFVERAVAALQSGARWAIQTDHAEYFEWIRANVDPRPELVEIPYDDAEFGIVNEEAGTNYEVKYLREGRPIFRVAYSKT